MLAWVGFFVLLAAWFFVSYGQPRALVLLLPGAAAPVVALVVWLAVRGDRIELAGGELRLHRLLPILDVAIPLAELDFAGRRPGWVSVHHHGIPRQLPLLFPDGPYFAAAIQLMTGAPLR